MAEPSAQSKQTTPSDPTNLLPLPLPFPSGHVPPIFSTTSSKPVMAHQGDPSIISRFSATTSSPSAIRSSTSSSATIKNGSSLSSSISLSSRTDSASHSLTTMSKGEAPTMLPYILPTSTTTVVPVQLVPPKFQWSRFPANLELCSIATMAWNYSGPQESLQFLVTSNVSQPIDPAITIATGIDATSQALTWQSVNVIPGQYTLEVLGPGIQERSPVFTITGEDTSCLAPVSSTASSGNGSSTATRTATIAPSMPSSPSPTPPSTALSHGVNIASIAGGAVAGALLLIAGGIWMGCRWRHSRRRARRPGAPPGDFGESGQREDAPMDDAFFQDTLPSYVTVHEKGTARHILIGTAERSLPPAEPIPRPPSALLGYPDYSAPPPYMPHAQFPEDDGAMPSSMDGSIFRVDSRTSMFSDAASTAGLTRPSVYSSSSSWQAISSLFTHIMGRRPSSRKSDAGLSRRTYGSGPAPSSATSQMYFTHDGAVIEV
ncbi:hypothetical protein BD311DRAFT_756687 [Dichomitus squalens]|uniref:Uncharacterized protein n=1 Tax=Dichomitus squalens TaxID=114155 RepID=A0A4Q9MT66_9APHY|nr:hypothetical protein BD311DRAFT_756687 [Dichomitus squalens]